MDIDAKIKEVIDANSLELPEGVTTEDVVEMTRVAQDVVMDVLGPAMERALRRHENLADGLRVAHALAMAASAVAATKAGAMLGAVNTISHKSPLAAGDPMVGEMIDRASAGIRQEFLHKVQISFDQGVEEGTDPDRIFDGKA